LEDQIIRLCRAISAVVDAMGSVGKSQDVLDCILHVLVEELGYRAASVRELDAERHTLVLTGALRLSEDYLAKGAVELERSALDREVLEGRLVEIVDIRNDPRLQYSSQAVQEGIGSILAAPLSLKGQINGVLRVYSAEPRTAPETEKLFLMSVGKLTARALASARQSETLLNISRQVNSSLDVQTVLTAILRRTVEELNYRGGIIRLLSPTGQRLELVAATGLSQAYLSKGVVEIERSGIDQKVLQGEMVTIYDVTADPGFQYPQEALGEGIRSVQAVPLVAPDRSEAGGRKVIGVLRVYSSQPHRFRDEEVSFLQVIANLGAMALQNARMFHELSRRIDSLQPDEDGWHRLV
jgi:two-component system, NtrC family, sensor kinase